MPKKNATRIIPETHIIHINTTLNCATINPAIAAAQANNAPTTIRAFAVAFDIVVLDCFVSKSSRSFV